MRTEIHSDDEHRQQQNLIIIGLLAIIAVGVVAWLLYNSFAANQRVASNAPVPTTGVPGQPVSPNAPVVPPQATPAAPGAGPAPSVPPVATPQRQAVPASRTTTVLGSVVATYPSGWTVNSEAGGAATVTNGKANFEIIPADPSAGDAKSIADAALADKAANADVKFQGARRIASQDAYVYVVRASDGGTVRIVGFDSPTRVAIVESVNGAPFENYSAGFQKMESELKFK